MQPIVTVILAAFNGADYLAEAIDSVRRQTLRDWRLIVVDDGSADATPEIAAACAAQDDRISVIRQANAGVAAARNTGLRAATTRWVALLDHDDMYLPTKLEKQMRFLNDHPEIGCFGTWGRRIGSRGRILGTFDVGPTSPEHFARMRADDRLIYMLASSVVFDRDIALALGGFRAEPGGTEDVALWNRIADTHAIQTLPERLVLYRVHGASVSATHLNAQRLNSERLALNNRHRRAGRREVGYEEFLAAWERQPEASKRKARRISRTLALYRQGGGMLADRSPLGLWYVLRSAWLSPMLIADRVIRQLGLHRRA